MRVKLVCALATITLNLLFTGCTPKETYVGTWVYQEEAWNDFFVVGIDPEGQYYSFTSSGGWTTPYEYKSGKLFNANNGKQLSGKIIDDTHQEFTFWQITTRILEKYPEFLKEGDSLVGDWQGNSTDISVSFDADGIAYTQNIFYGSDGLGMYDYKVINNNLVVFMGPPPMLPTDHQVVVLRLIGAYTGDSLTLVDPQRYFEFQTTGEGSVTLTRQP